MFCHKQLLKILSSVPRLFWLISRNTCFSNCNLPSNGHKKIGLWGCKQSDSAESELFCALLRILESTQRHFLKFSSSTGRVTAAVKARAALEKAHQELFCVSF